MKKNYFHGPLNLMLKDFPYNFELFN